MGKFKISDMLPSFWLCRLSRISRSAGGNPTRKKQNAADTSTSPASPTSPPRNLTGVRKSYHVPSERFAHEKFITRGTDSGQKSGPRRPGRRSRRSSPRLVGAADCGCRERLSKGRNSVYSSPFLDTSDDKEFREPFLPEFRSDGILPTESSDALGSWSTWSRSGSSSSKSVDPISDEPSFHFIPPPPIVTKKKNYVTTSPRRVKTRSPGVRLRVKSPRFAHARVQGHGRKSTSTKSLSESFAVVKSSADPEEDFRESMMEMIVQRNIWESRDLEELLACYLSLNSDEYHHLIISVFKKIWAELAASSASRRRN